MLNNLKPRAGRLFDETFWIITESGPVQANLVAVDLQAASLVYLEDGKQIIVNGKIELRAVYLDGRPARATYFVSKDMPNVLVHAKYLTATQSNIV